MLLFLLLFLGQDVKEPIELPENKKTYWEDLVPIFEDGLEEEYGPRARKFAPWILEASAHYEVPPTLLARLIARESSFRSVTSSRGAIGPAQIKPRFWEKFCGSHNIRVPEGNVHCSAQILSSLVDKCGNYRCALAHYNAGHGRPVRGYVDYILEN